MNTGADVQINPYDKVFDETNKHWVRNMTHNELFVGAQMNWTQDMLSARGFLFLNEVYEALGFPLTKFGATNGWIKGPMKFKAISYPETGQIKLEFTVEGDILSAFPEF